MLNWDGAAITNAALCECLLVLLLSQYLKHKILANNKQ
jgi:hypothetical protein